MQPLTASEIDEVLDLLASGERDISRETISRLCVQARLAPQWRPGSEPPDHDCDVMTTDGILTYSGQTWIGGYGEDRDFVDRPSLWTYLPQPPAAPGEGEKA